MSAPARAGDLDAPIDAAHVKACCASFYEADVVRLLLGDQLHPGGEALTRRLADLLEVADGELVLDVASGTGATARLLATERGASVHGLELASGLVALARRRADEEGLGHTLRFAHGDAEAPPIDGSSFDVVICECALCTFPDQPAAVRGFARALVPGGRLGLADVTADPARLPPELGGVLGRIACVSGARPVEGYVALLRDAGFDEIDVERHDEAALAMIDLVGSKLAMLRDAFVSMWDVDAAIGLIDVARRAVDDGVLGYALITARLRTAKEGAGR